jgi:putative ATP-binding cassette transporter
MSEREDGETRKLLLGCFWESALGFWRRGAGRTAWVLTVTIVVVAVVNVLVQYEITVWYRTMFDALDKRDGSGLLRQSLLFVPLTVANVGLAVAALQGRMTMQRRWRAWLNGHVLDRWLASGRYYQLNLVSGDHQNPEYRISDDLRLACEAPVDFGVGILNAVLSVITFVSVLWFIGGALAIPLGSSRTIEVPGFLVLAAILYAVVASGSMMVIGRRFVRISENKNQAEAEYRYALTRLRENGESIALLGGEDEERSGLDAAFRVVLKRWREFLGQYRRTTVVSQTSAAFVPVIPLILCAPKYVAGTMTLGEVMQASSAFVTVQVAFNWVVDNYPRLADWTASARRLASVLEALGRLDSADKEETGRIQHTETEGAALRLRNLSVTLDDGSAVVNEADVEIKPGEKVLVAGESGTGKSTLVRAVSGLWPWGSDEVAIGKGKRLFLMPQQPYVPLGSLRRAASYPQAPDQADDALVRKTLKDVGLGHFVERIDEDTHWESVLSGGEKQRLAFARIFLHRPDIIVMDEATSALDPESQECLMRLLMESLADATVVSVGHRPELEKFHTRKLVLEYHPDGARLARDEVLRRSPLHRPARILTRVFNRDEPGRLRASA